MTSTDAQPDGFARTYNVELLYPERPVLNKALLLEQLQARRPAFTPFDGDVQNDMLAFLYPAPSPGGVPAQCLIAHADPEATIQVDEAAVTQSWHWPDAREAIADCRASVLVTDLLAAGLPHRQRLEFFQDVVTTLLELTPCRAIYWRPAGHYVAPIAFLERMRESGTGFPLPGGINVRSFHISGTDDTLMDTLGLAALGLRDLQVRFQRHNPEAMLRMLYNSALYLFENGLVIADGHTLQGLEPRDRWRCRYEQSVIEPQRPVIDIDTGDRA